MEGLSVLEEIFKKEFLRTEVQRRIVHLSHNVLAKVLQKLKGQIGSELRLFFMLRRRR